MQENTVAMSNRVIDTGSRVRRRMENKGLSTKKGRLLLRGTERTNETSSLEFGSEKTE